MMVLKTFLKMLKEATKPAAVAIKKRWSTIEHGGAKTAGRGTHSRPFTVQCVFYEWIAHRNASRASDQLI